MCRIETGICCVSADIHSRGGRCDPNVLPHRRRDLLPGALGLWVNSQITRDRQIPLLCLALAHPGRKHSQQKALECSRSDGGQQTATSDVRPVTTGFDSFCPYGARSIYPSVGQQTVSFLDVHLRDVWSGRVLVLGVSEKAAWRAHVAGSDIHKQVDRQEVYEHVP